MSRICEISKKKTAFGYNVSHANNRTKRRFYPNLQKKRFYLAEQKKWIVLKVCTSVIRTINKNGVEAVLRKSKKDGLLSGRVRHLFS
jgi:large subunit ribosomal protein L28